MAIDAELKRRDEDDALVSWKLVDDPDNAATEKSDPVIDHGVRDRLDAGLLSLSPLVPAKYDEIVIAYTGENITQVVYKDAGATVATLDLSYTGDHLTSVVRS